MEINKTYQGDCIKIMKGFEENSVDSIVTDPPYGLEFMNKKWDSINKHFSPIANKKYPKSRNTRGLSYESEPNAMQDWHYQWTKECLRVLKPGGHLLSFGGTRTYHRMVCAIEDAGFEIRDTLQWLYGSGFPKNLDISKTIDKQKKKNYR